MNKRCGYAYPAIIFTFKTFKCITDGIRIKLFRCLFMITELLTREILF